jgi:hypothetical protein
MIASTHRYRSHTCGALRAEHIGSEARLSGWCHRIRDHGGVLFIDLRDHYGMTQIVVDPDSPAFRDAEKVRSEWVIRVDGKVRQRPAGTENANLPTGAIEMFVTDLEVLGQAAELPLQVFGDTDFPEETRLKYREGGGFHASAHEGGGVQRIRDADPHRLLAGRRARLSGAEPHPSRQVLRAAAGAAAIQAASDDGRVRPVFPDRAVLSR